MDNFDENDFDESYSENDVNPSFDGFNSFNNGFQNSYKQKDISSINDRAGKNEQIRNAVQNHENTNSSSEKEGISGSVKGKGLNELESSKKESDVESNKSSKNDDSLHDKKSDKKNKNSLFGSSKEGFFKNKLLKYKIYLIIAGVAIGIFAFMFILLVIIGAIEKLTMGLISFDTSDGAGNITDSSSDGVGNIQDSYLDDIINKEDLIAYLENNYSCNSNVWTDISDDWNSLQESKINDVCELIRYVKSKTKNTGVDETLIISTIFYGYDTRPTSSQYINKNDIPKVAETNNQFQNLEEILQDKNINITRSKIDELIENSYTKSKSYYYVWKIDTEKDNKGNVNKVIGKCEYKEYSGGNYNLDKWKVYMRFGGKAAYKFDDVILKSKNFESSSPECKNEGGIYTNEELKKQLSRAASIYGEDVTYELDTKSVEKARKNLETSILGDSEAFYQAADTKSKRKDIFKSYNGITFDYKNGYAYQNFPSFKPSMEIGEAYHGKVNISYDDIYTPKEIESLIQNIIDKKRTINNALDRDDPDLENNDEVDLNSYSGVPASANCKRYLTSNLSEIQVELTDCYGNHIEKVNFKDYIIGVANGGVSNNNDDYILSQMIVAISYALNSQNNYTKGNQITMRSGTCDQVYCSLTKGCNTKNTPVGTCDKCNSYYIGGSKSNPNLYSKYQALYEIASEYLFVKDGKPFSAHYASTSQNRWYDKASKGISFIQIMQEEYKNEGAKLIRCSNSDSEVKNPNLSEKNSNKKGNKATNEYPKVSSDLGNFYGFSYKDGSDGIHITINPEWKDTNLVTISPKCDGNTTFSNKKYTVHKSAVKNFEKAFDNVCKILTDGIKITDGSTCKYTENDILDGTVFIERKTSSGTFDLHAYGISQDLNYSKKININGKDYTPYNTRELSEYLEFVNAIGGKEENCKNINYILWRYAYKDAGFYWGGNYGRNGNYGSYDGKLFELKYE